MKMIRDFLITKSPSKVPINQNEKNWINGTELLRKLLMYGSLSVIVFLTTYDFRLNRFTFFIDVTRKSYEGKSYISSINKGQQEYFFEKRFFATSLETLGLGIKSETNSYQIQMLASMGPIQTDNQVKLPNFISTIAIAKPKKLGFQSFIGIVFATPNNDGQTFEQVCESNIPNYPIDVLPVLKNVNPVEIECPLGFQPSFKSKPGA